MVKRWDNVDKVMSDLVDEGDELLIHAVEDDARAKERKKERGKGYQGSMFG